MGLAGALAGAHRFDGLRVCAYGMTMEMPWPDHPAFPPVGYVITRHDLDQLVAERAAKAGATIWEGAEAVAPLLDEAAGTPNGAPRGGRWHSASVRGGGRRATATAAPPSRCGPATWWWPTGPTPGSGGRSGTGRNRSYPMGMALRGYYRSPRHDDGFIESHLDIRDASGKVVPGYGWIFPLGDGRVNVGVGLLTGEGRWKGVNTSHLMDAFVAHAPKSWGLSPETSCGAPTGGKLPMGLSVGPRMGPTTLVIGDASGAINPFNGEGIAYGYETGRLAASVVGRALAGEGPDALADYERQVEEAYGLYYLVARDFVRMISNPAGHGGLPADRDAVHAASWAGCCGSWPTCCAPKRSVPAEAAYRAMAVMARAAERR